MKKAFIAICSALILAGPVSHADTTSQFVSTIFKRLTAVKAMPPGEARSANVVLLLSDLMNYASNMGTNLQQTDHISGVTSAVTKAEQAYQTYHSWNNPYIATEVNQLRSTISQFQTTIQALATSASQLQFNVQTLSSGLSVAGAKIQAKYAQKPIGPIAQNVIGWGKVVSTSYGNLANLYSSYAADMQAYLNDMNTNTNPGNLASELTTIENEIQNFKPSSPYTYANIAQFFQWDSQKIRSTYPGMN